ncbi:hypothetical protein SCHPADRAFT_947574 [Schizopora paradoxa]|uniref:Uncharacterized protein n=1 Tax=Schizopora paradoxa TaxID=27342 RepID=A0A0H2R560_9AGAM|nr:hypothetical protein SCHPADRAFT_947574 [Schizopora paradoxa]
MESYPDDSELPKYEARTTEDVQHDVKVLIDTFIHPSAPYQPRGQYGLSQPFCLPQSGGGFDTPFARGYGPALYQLGISQNTFLDFVDGLNMAMISSPPLQVVDMAGMLIGFVPHWTFAVAGAALQTSAQVGMHVVSKTLSDRYLQAANARLFAPLGLRARLCKTPALRVLVNHPEARSEEPSKLKKFGQSAGDIILHLPLPITKKIVRALMDKPPPIDPNITDPLTRRLMIMHGYISPVDYGPALPPPSNPDSVMGKMNGYAVGKKRAKVDKKEQDASARRQILAGMPVTREGGMTKKDHKMMKDISRGKTRKIKKKVELDALHEHRANEKLIWLVIINEADDAKIGGKDVMDSSSDNIAFDDRQLEDARGRYMEDERSYYSESDDLYKMPTPHASGSRSRHEGP